MGDYQTNCYIVTINEKDIIIDPGINSTSWVKENVKNPIAILNTHGHFDHVWCNKELKNDLNLKIYCPRDDVFMLEDDPFDQGTPSSNADVIIKPNEQIELNGIKIKFHHFPGHTPGCSAIEIQNILFSGDFIFSGSIGRVDFPYSSPGDMSLSIKRILSWDRDIEIYPGHGNKTSLENERHSLNNWLNYL
jgi:glyoxylase-like metal-dependent hydrolase (beta-lactamase superfamily II)